MAHSKESMLEEMRLKGGAIMAMLTEEEVTIKPDHLHIPEDAIELRADFIRPAYYWLGGIYEKEFVEVRRIKKMQPDEMWARYKRWGMSDDYREVTLLKSALHALRTILVSRTRPDFFKKSKRALKDNKTQSSSPSEETSS